MKKNLFLCLLVPIALGLLASEAYAIEPMTQTEMDEVIAGDFSLATISGTVDTSASASTQCKDGVQCWGNSTGGGVGVAQVPVYNGLTVKNDTLSEAGTEPPGQVGPSGGHVAAAHNFAQTTVDSSDHSNNTNSMMVEASGDAAAAHGAGSTALKRVFNPSGRPKNTDDVSGIFHGESTTILLTRTLINGHGNNSDELDGTNQSEVEKRERQTLEEDVQESSSAIALANSLVEVGSGVNTLAHTNASEGMFILNGTSAVQFTRQNVYNFSETKPVAGTSISVIPVSIANVADFSFVKQ